MAVETSSTFVQYSSLSRDKALEFWNTISAEESRGGLKGQDNLLSLEHRLIILINNKMSLWPQKTMISLNFMTVKKSLHFILCGCDDLRVTD